MSVRIGLVALLAAAAIVTERRHRGRARLDPASAALLAVIAAIRHCFAVTRGSASILQVMGGGTLAVIAALIFSNA